MMQNKKLDFSAKDVIEPECSTSGAVTAIYDERQVRQTQYNQWLDEFLAKAAKALGVTVELGRPVRDLVPELEKSGYFGLAHHAETPCRLNATPRNDTKTRPQKKVKQGAGEVTQGICSAADESTH